MKNYIPMDQCKNGGLYRISSRNLDLGVYNATSQGFIGIREKFGNLYLFTEYHWDTGEPFGTVCPIELLEDCPLPPTEKIQSVVDEEYIKTAITSAVLVGDTIKIENEALFEWLAMKEKQYCDRTIE
jgi:hypothetical protein